MRWVRPTMSVAVPIRVLSTRRNGLATVLLLIMLLLRKPLQLVEVKRGLGLHLTPFGIAKYAPTLGNGGYGIEVEGIFKWSSGGIAGFSGRMKYYMPFLEVPSYNLNITFRGRTCFRDGVSCCQRKNSKHCLALSHCCTYNKTVIWSVSIRQIKRECMWTDYIVAIWRNILIFCPDNAGRVMVLPHPITLSVSIQRSASRFHQVPTFLPGKDIRS